MKNQRSRGVGLIECVVALGLVALLAASALSRIKALRSGRVLERELHYLGATIERLHLGVVTRGLPATVEIFTDRWMARWNPPEEGIETRGIARRFPAEVTAVVPVDAPVMLTLHPSGAVSPRTIRLTAGATCGSITVSLRGRVTFVR